MITKFLTQTIGMSVIIIFAVMQPMEQLMCPFLIVECSDILPILINLFTEIQTRQKIAVAINLCQFHVSEYTPHTQSNVVVDLLM